MKRFRARSSQQSGFALIEVLIASIVMIIGVFGILAVFPNAYHTTTASGRVSVLNHLAAEKIEQLRSLDYAAAELSAGIHPALGTDSSSNKYYPVPGFGEEHSLRWTVSDGPTDGGNNPEPEMKTIVVEATYLTRYTVAEAPIETAQSLGVVFRTYLRE